MARHFPSPLLPALTVLLLASTNELHAQCQALRFDGIDDTATVLNGNGALDLGSAMTVEAWVRNDAPATGAFAVAGRVTPSSGTSWALGSALSSPTTALVLISTPGTDSLQVPGEWPANGVWRHYAATYDGSLIELFVNGQSVGTHVHASGGSVSTIEAVIFGRWPGVSRYLAGAVDEVRIWNFVRPAADIQADYLSALVGDEPGLVGYFKFDEGGGDVILDSSLSGNNGYLGGAAGPGSDDPSRIPNGLPFNPCSTGTQYCPGDGVSPHTPCPCGNNNNGSMGGCDWGSTVFTSGGVLDAIGSVSMAANDTHLIATAVSNDFGIFFGAALPVNGGNGNPLNDGLRCAGGGLVRLIPPTMASANTARTTTPIQVLDTGAAAGVTRRYQYWFRTPGGPCGSSANLTNGYEIVWGT